MFLGLSVAAILIYKDKDIVGTIFGGTSLILAGSIFIRNPENKSKNK